MRLISRHRRGFTLLEFTLVSGLMVIMAWVISSAWAGLGHPTVDLMARSQLLQETDMVVTALSRDLGGALADPTGRIGGKKVGQWVGWMVPSPTQLWLCFDGGPNPDGQAEWEPPDTVIIYQWNSDGTLTRTDRTTNTTFTVAKNISSMSVTSDSTFIYIQLTFNYRDLTRTCTLAARFP